jgi:hypothetical protein
MMRSSAAGATGWTRDTAGGWSLRIAPSRLAWVWPSNAVRPVSISNSSAPNAKMSVRAREADVGVLVLTRPEPRVLDDILGFAGAAEHPVRNREQQRSMRLERCLVPVSRCHGSRRLALLLLSRRMTEAVCDSGVPRPRVSQDYS